MFSVTQLSPTRPPAPAALPGSASRAPGEAGTSPEPAALPEVDIHALAFHRWRTLKWRLRFTEPGAPGTREARTPTFDAALTLARDWSLAYRARGIEEAGAR